MGFNNSYCSIQDAWGSLVEPPSKKDKRRVKRSKDPICELYNMSSGKNYDELEMIRASNSDPYGRYNKTRFQKDRQVLRERPKYVTIDAREDKDEIPLYKRKVSDDMSLDSQFNTAITNAQCSQARIRLPELESHFDTLTDNQDNESCAGDSDTESDYIEFKNLLKRKQCAPAPAPSMALAPETAPSGYEDFEAPYDEPSPLEDIEPNTRRPPKRITNPLNDIDIEESFTDDFYSSKKTNNGYLDLILYIVSGIILIFILEQFVKIGLLLQ